MATYHGHHRQPGRHRAPAVSTHHRLHPKALRRPLLSTGAALALLGATAVGYAKAGDATDSVQTFTVPAGALEQANASNNILLEEDANQRTAASAAAMKASANADAAAAAAARAAAARKAAAQKLAAERQAAAQRAARAAQRQAVIDRARSDPRSAARMLLADYGWSDGQWSCLDQLWSGESGWNYRASNSSSGAYGIPQSLPASKMATVAPDYLTNPVTQITWGMQYIQRSYGTPCGALSRWNSRYPHWY